MTKQRSGSRSATAVAPTSVQAAFDLTGRVAVITGGAGLLGERHGAAVAEMGGIPILLDVDQEATVRVATTLESAYGVPALGLGVDVTDPAGLRRVHETVHERFGGVDLLVNNAARNPKVEGGGAGFSRLEGFPLEEWEQDLCVGLTGAFLCTQVFGPDMARRGKGVILNIASDLALIGPDQRLYRRKGLPEDEQPVKPVTYSVIKSGLIGLTRYAATYWAHRGVRCNALSPGGIYAGQDDSFLRRLEPLIPLGRMAHRDEYKAAVVFLVSDASSYMNGANLTIDGGRTCW
jgi:NAD(P)-dependent dehydrogenase (short-subunit alcohol dehydrogenase family)